MLTEVCFAQLIAGNEESLVRRLSQELRDLLIARAINCSTFVPGKEESKF